MNILAIDASSIVASVAISNDTHVLGEFSLNCGKTHSETLVPIIEQTMKFCGLKMEDIDCFAATTGPGSFTGLRIGAATIKGLAYATNKKIVPVSTLDALAYNVLEGANLIVPIMDARRNQVYCAVYQSENGVLTKLTDDLCIELDALFETVKGYNRQAVFLGDGVLVFAETILQEGFLLAPLHLNMQRAASVCAIAQVKAKRGEFETYDTFALEYLRISQAERELLEKELEKENKGIKIEKMTVNDLDGVFAVEQESFSIPWSFEEFRKEVCENKLAIYFVAKDYSVTPPQILGYAGMWHVVNEGHITNVAVAPSKRRLGVGDLLVDTLVKVAIEKEMLGLTLEVRMGNASAMKLYSKHGFKPEGIRKNYYADTKEDAVIMWKYFEEQN